MAGYDVLVLADSVIVTDVGRSRQFPVPDYGTAIGDLAARPGFRLGWGRFPDEAEVFSLGDAGAGGFGDAVNLTVPEFGGWGYAHVAQATGDAGPSARALESGRGGGTDRPPARRGP